MALDLIIKGDQNKTKLVILEHYVIPHHLLEGVEYVVRAELESPTKEASFEVQVHGCALVVFGPHMCEYTLMRDGIDLDSREAMEAFPEQSKEIPDEWLKDS